MKISSIDYKRKLKKFLTNFGNLSRKNKLHIAGARILDSAKSLVKDEEWNFKMESVTFPIRVKNGTKTHKESYDQLKYLGDRLAKISFFIEANAKNLILQDQTIQVLILIPKENGKCPICEKPVSEEYSVLRKFHFDFDLAHNKSQIAHLQYGGECGDKSVHYCDYNPNLELPRIFIDPRSIQGVIDCFVNEFKLLTNLDNNWKSTVSNGESLFFKTFIAKFTPYIEEEKDTSYNFYRTKCC